MDVSRYRHTGTIHVDCPPESVYELISDVTRVGELSPVCRAAEWDDAEAGCREGAWFTGRNAIGDITWETRCRVVAAEPGREFAFVNHGPDGNVELVSWSYLLEPDGAGTNVTECWQLLPAYPAFITGGDASVDAEQRIDGMALMARDGIRQTLANLKRVAEA